MSISVASRTDWIEIARELGSRFAARAAAHDAEDRFVADNYAELRRQHVFWAGVPAELGGGGGALRELCEVLRVLAHACPSTALALSMHTHALAGLVWRWRHAPASVEPLLRRIVAEELVLVTTGGSDFLVGSGTAVKADGGYRVTARKSFASGSPGGDLMMTMAVHDDPVDGPTVLHFLVALDAPGVSLADNWRTLGMRGTGSNDVVLDGVFVPEAAVAVRRPSGRWHPLLYVVFSLAAPLVYSVYLGIAESARDIALRETRRRGPDVGAQMAVGEMENQLAATRMAVHQMIETAEAGDFGQETARGAVIGRTLAGRAAVRTVEKAIEVVGGAAFYRALGLERLFRDVQAARFHQLQERPETLLVGRLALGLDVNE
jgi:acyl-CoA dehydrogenase